ncbi:MAG: tetratricopeptide repeat protein [Gammaproteobacteria bacterium]
MDPSQWQKIKRALQEVLELDAEQWPGYLDRACHGDPELREQIEALLKHRSTDDFMATPLLGERHDEPDLIGTTIGRYRMVRKLGSGGMGEVYEAEQLEPFVRTVAVKLLRRDLYAHELTERFDSEHRALAMMNHPNIAQVFDADWTTDRRPYFVMEFVPGETINDALDALNLGIRERIDLFLQVCDGVQHAHRKGIIHRDLKPSNVLVCSVGGRLVVKIIDFGVAKGARRIARTMAGSANNDDSGQTQVGTWIGTSGYASPEQATGSTDIDTRSDIYSLGALLFEMLAQCSAYDELALKTMSRNERLKIICEMPTDPPSERCEDSATADALRGDLDHIVLKAMAKRADDRYATVSELGADLRRHLNQEPVLAMHGGWRYRAGKLVRRRAMAVAAVGLISALLAGGTVASTLGYLKATRARAAAAIEAERANSEARKANQIAEFLAELFRVSDPTRGSANDVSAREILERGAARVDADTKMQPATRALLLDTIGVVYTNLGWYDEAEQPLRRALELRQSLHGERHLDVAASRNHVGKLYYFKGQQEHAREQYQQALATHRALLGNDDIATAQTHNNLGELLVAQADFEGAMEEHRQALEIRQRVLGDTHRDVGMSFNNLAGALRRKGDVTGAEAAYRRAIAVNRQALGENNSEVATNLSNLGVFLMEAGQYEEAFALHADALRIRRSVLDDNHPHIANSLHNVGSLQVHLGNYTQAEPLVIESLAMHETLHGRQHPLVALTRNNLGVVNENLARHTDALAQYDDALAVFRATVGDAHPYVGITQTNRARVLSLMGQHQKSLTQASAAEANLSAVLGPDHWRVAVAQSVRGAALARLGQLAEAEPLLTNSLATIIETQGEKTPYAQRARARLALLD